jgi:asparagine synthase (glutamine-hydrolysing)
MCGISGVVSQVGCDETVIRRINETLVHRGPDGEGYQSFENGRIWFGHRRLSIIDLSDAGRQPMCYASRYWITYNGEIYNYLELKKELAALGLKFSTKTDAEVILAAYATWGVDCLNRFNGMWSFVLYDAHKGELFLARDRFGIKPLHYYHKDGLFVFASEIKAILQHPDVETAPDLVYCREYLTKGAREYLRETAFENIWRFPHACYARVTAQELLSGGIQPVRYWKLVPNLSREPFNETKADDFAARYRELLKDAVRLRLRSDVKVGSALSGGLDSSSIVMLINEAIKETGADLEKQHTFSVVYPQDDVSDCDESKYIDAVANALDVRSQRITPEARDIPNECYKNIYAMDNPPESTLMSSWHTFMLVSRTDVIVTLDGQGADEQLAGYWRYITSYIAATGPVRFSGLSKWWSIPGARKYVLRGLTMWAASKMMPKRLLLRLTRPESKDGESALDPLNEILCREIQTALVNLLHFADRTSMAFSIESRMPFMDYRVMEFLASVPFSYKLHDGWTKYLARAGMRGSLPDDIVWRKDKMGWPIPEDHWFRGPLKEWFCQVIERSAFLKMLGVGQDIRQRIGGKESITLLVRILNLAIWHEIYFEKHESTRALRTRLRLSEVA